MLIKQINLNYNFDIFLRADYSNAETNGSWHTSIEQKDIHNQYGGYPPSYNHSNTSFYQLWWDSNQVNFQTLGNQLNMEVITVSSIKQNPGCVIPIHKDEFYQIKKRFPDRKEIKVRALIFLEDWKLGHFVQYQDTVVSNWSAGQGWIWDNQVLHLSSNAGMEPKYTLQVSGFLNA